MRASGSAKWHASGCFVYTENGEFVCAAASADHAELIVATASPLVVLANDPICRYR